MLGEPRLRPVHHGLEDGYSELPCFFTLGDEKLSFGKTAPYSFMHSRILASNSGKANLETSSSTGSSSSSSDSSL
jgi:hypothetical protein